MKVKAKYSWLFTSLLVVMTGTTIAADNDDYGLNAMTYDGPYDEAIVNGAIHVLAQQCDDGGWGYPHNTCPASGSVYSITATMLDAVLTAYDKTGLSVFMESAVAAGDFNLGSTYTSNGSPAIASLTPLSLWNLTALTGDTVYTDWIKSGFYEALLSGTYGRSGDFDTADYINDVRANVLNNTIMWVHASQPLAAERYCYQGIADQFEQAILDAFTTLDGTGEIYDVIGLASGILGLARVNRLVFPEIVAPLQIGVNGETTLAGITDYLVSLQNANGSFNHISAASGGIEHTQTTAYAILALIKAQERLPSKNYLPAIESAKNWLVSIQDPDGGFPPYAGGGYGTATESEAVYALGKEGVYDRIFQGQMECYVN